MVHIVKSLSLIEVAVAVNVESYQRNKIKWMAFIRNFQSNKKLKTKKEIIIESY